MITQFELAQTLANALGLPRRHVEDTARHLQSAGLLPDDSGAEATVENAVALHRFATVSSAIFVVLRELFVADDGPRWATLSQEQVREIFAEL